MRTGRFMRGLNACALIVGTVALGSPAGRAQTSGGGLGLEPIKLDKIELRDSYWKDRLQLNATVTLEALWKELEERGLFANFDLYVPGAEGEHTGDPRHDALVYELLAGTAAAQAMFPSESVGTRVDALVARIAAGQQDNGYLNTLVQSADRPNYWKDLPEGRELYCAAYLIEAGIALADYTGKTELLEVAVKIADLIYDEFGPEGPRVDPPGHPAIEAALVHLARKTGESRYVDLATIFIDMRGNPDRERLYGEHAVDDHRLFKTRIAYGSVERAVELQRGVTEIARSAAYEDFYNHAITIADNVFRKKTYVTGGLGVRPEFGERCFADVYELPQESAACETCSGALSLRWHHAQFLLTEHAVYPSLVEDVLYNVVLAGVKTDGAAFRRDNPLAAKEGVGFVPWTGSGCCEVAAFRAIAEVPEGAFAYKGNHVHLSSYLPCEVEVPMGGNSVRLVVESDYPRSGKIAIHYDSNWTRDFFLHVLIPAWCVDGVPIGVNEITSVVAVEHGEDAGTYLAFQREWEKGDTLLIELPLVPERVAANPKIAAHKGRVCLRRGPEVYAFEAIDNGGQISNIYLPPDAELTEEWREDLLGGVMLIHAEGMARVRKDGKILNQPVTLTAVPYNVWGERDSGEMLVWIPEG